MAPISAFRSIPFDGKGGEEDHDRPWFPSHKGKAHLSGFEFLRQVIPGRFDQFLFDGIFRNTHFRGNGGRIRPNRDSNPGSNLLSPRVRLCFWRTELEFGFSLDLYTY